MMTKQVLTPLLLTLGRSALEALRQVGLFIHLLIARLFDLSPKLFCFLGLFFIFLDPSSVSRMIDEHGAFILLQPQFVAWVKTTFTLTIIAIFFGTMLEQVNILMAGGYATAQHLSAPLCVSSSEKTRNHDHELAQLRSITDAAYSYHGNYPVWKAQQELRDSACQLAENNIAMPHFDELDSYLGRIVDAAKCAVDQQYPFSNTNGFHSSCLADIRGELPSTVNNASRSSTAIKEAT